jgi:hypothetical protein
MMNVVKLIDTIGHLMHTNHTNRVSLIERQMCKYLQQVIVPRSLANSEDIDYLRWLLNQANFRLRLCGPLLNEVLLTSDHLNTINRSTFQFVLTPHNLNVSLVESDQQDMEAECEDSVQDLMDGSYVDFVGGQLVVKNNKIEALLAREKEQQPSGMAVRAKQAFKHLNGFGSEFSQTKFVHLFFVP